MKAERIKAAQALIAFLAECHVAAVICGGYARDTICDQPIRDVDVYVPERDWVVAAVALTKTPPSKLSDSPDDMCVDQGSAEYLHQSVRMQKEFTLRSDKDFGLPTTLVNIIGLKDDTPITVQEVIGRYNFGICQAGIDAQKIDITDEFRRDYKDKQITLLRLEWGHEASLKQYIKLHDKYPWPMRLKEQEVF